MYQNYLFYLYYLSSQAISSIVSSSSISWWTELVPTFHPTQQLVPPALVSINDSQGWTYLIPLASVILSLWVLFCFTSWLHNTFGLFPLPSIQRFNTLCLQQYYKIVTLSVLLTSWMPYISQLFISYTEDCITQGYFAVGFNALSSSTGGSQSHCPKLSLSISFMESLPVIQLPTDL